MKVWAIVRCEATTLRLFAGQLGISVIEHASGEVIDPHPSHRDRGGVLTSRQCVMGLSSGFACCVLGP